MAEFTGERLIPGQVDVDLLNEHVSRYAFAARLARGKRVLDAGCGAGYGSAELARTAERVVGADVAAEAINFARSNYGRPNLRFEQASCAALPHPDGAFDLVVSFEVIEHIENWREFLAEARRVLAPGGQFIVSTPNKLYYEESRGAEGANPFHVHEFEFEEFRCELKAVFPHVSLFLENHAEGIVFQPEQTGPMEAQAEGAGATPAESHFFLAVCARQAATGIPGLVYVPRAANVLRERGRHIALLEDELAAKDEWLETARTDLAGLEREHRKVLDELERSNRWASDLNAEIEERRARVVALQQEAAELERELAARAEWGFGLQAKVERLEETLAAVRWSRWVRLGRKIGLGPAL